MARIRTLVVEDSITIRKYLVEVLGRDPAIEVVGEAEDGPGAIRSCEKLRPDVVTLDVILPTLSGVSVTEHIMAYFPTPILIVSGSRNRGEVWRTLEALAAGAVDALDKPSGNGFDDLWEKDLIGRVKLLSRVGVVTHPRAKLAALTLPGAAKAAAPAPAPLMKGERSLVAIGASTGGPGAVAQILRSLPERFPMPILLVVHIGPAFGISLADWLDAQSAIRVSEAKDGEPLPRPGEGRVLMAPSDRHLVVAGDRLRLTRDAERHSCRPSVDVLFESVAREVGAKAVGCILTGMGKDGAAGLLAMRRAGATTFAQDEATSVVFGMPQEAIRLGAAEHVLPLETLAPALANAGGLGAPRRAT